VIAEAIRPLVDGVGIDSSGNVIAHKKGPSEDDKK